jgi:hypothetical protein
LSFHLEHPQPEVLARALGALAVEVTVVPGATSRLAARIDGPRGPAALR